MYTTVRYATTLAALAVMASAAAQEPLRAAPTAQERITALEAAVATLETRFGLQSTRPSDLGTGESGVALTARVDRLERSLEQLQSELQRVARTAENAERAASQAQRDATSAQQAARDAAMRTR